MLCTLIDLCPLEKFQLKIMPHAKLVRPRKFVFLLALLTFLSLSIGSASRPEMNSALVEAEASPAAYERTSNAYFSGLKPAVALRTENRAYLLDFSEFAIREHIMDTGHLSMERLLSFLWLHNQRLNLQDARHLAALYLQECRAEGVNHDIAFSQMCLETGYLKYTGDVGQGQYNYCGLGATGNGEPGLHFDNPQQGVRAHIQHLKAYASIDSLNQPLVDSRFHYVKRGSVQSFKELTGKWASDPMYHLKINSILERLYDGSYAKPHTKASMTMR